MPRTLLSRRRAMWLAALGLSAIFAPGCGGGSSAPTRSSAPTDQTRTRLASLQNQQLRALSQSGVQPASFASARNSGFANASTMLVGGSSSAGGANIPGGSNGAMISSFPLIGAFISNVAIVRPVSAGSVAAGSGRRAAYRTRRHTREEGADPNFYFDEFLGLWVQIQDAPTSSDYLLFVDQAKKQAAGSFHTVFPATDTFPQTFESHYAITAGALQGTHGDYVTVQNDASSGRSDYNNAYGDGWSDRGHSEWKADGASTWNSRTEGPNGAFYTYRGAFKADGSGTNHTEASDGYVTDYTYNADGSGSGRIQGPAPGLPATLTWDIFGDTTIHYADGTTEHYSGWGFVGGSLVGVDGTGVSGGGSESSGGNQ